MSATIRSPWKQGLDESEEEDVSANERIEKNGIIIETQYMKDVNGDLVKVVTKTETLTRKTQALKSAVDRLETMRRQPAFGIVIANTNKMTDAHKWTVETGSAMQEGDEYDFSLSCFKKKSDGLLDLFAKKDLKTMFDKLDQSSVINIDALDDTTTTPGERGLTGRPGMINGKVRMGHTLGQDNRGERPKAIRVSNLSPDISDVALKGLFTWEEEGGGVNKSKKKFEVERVYIPKDDRTGESRGFAFVTYKDPNDGEAAVKKFNKFLFENVMLAVEWAKPPKPKV